MPYKDPDQERAATRERVRRHRARKGTAIGRLVQDAAELPEPPDRDFLLRALGVQAREGNVAAIKLLLEEYRREGSEKKSEPSIVDQLAARRYAQRAQPR